MQGWTPSRPRSELAEGSKVQTPTRVTVPFHFLPERPGAQPSASASSANTAYAPATCLAILPTAASVVAALAPIPD
ncbi:unnamed protein product [Boreogadus saida]